MARDTTDDRPIESHSQLTQWLSKGNKPKEAWRIGTEHEKFGFCTRSLKPVPYEGERGIGKILEILGNEPGWDILLTFCLLDQYLSDNEDTPIPLLSQD